MAQPSDLIAHYSSRIFQTRIYALTMVGSVLAASINWITEVDKSNFVGFLLILIVASLAESNRRYTHSYLCACFASSSRESKSNEVASWYLFRHMNEQPWSDKSCKSCVARFMLYWSTYIPGIITGEYLIFRDSGPVLIGWIATIVSVCIVLWWMYLAASPLDPKQLLINYKPKHDKGDSESENTKNT